MFFYMYRDIMSKVQYIPMGLLLGIPIAYVLLHIFNDERKKAGKDCLKAVPFFLLCSYCIFVLIMTLLSRENGSTGSRIDLRLFSTLKINKRNNAYLFENILLFLPYGFLLKWNFAWARHILICTFIGFWFSLCIETVQLITARGCFQLDDIVANVAGAFLGALLCGMVQYLFGRKTMQSETVA